jgi:uncharacterized membrane protein (DUF2068 family)
VATTGTSLARLEDVHGDAIVRLIGVFKLVKAALLVVVGVGALSLLGHRLAPHLLGWADAVTLDHRRLRDAVDTVELADRRQLGEVGAGLLGYAALFTVEGVGLLARKTWAEYLTVVITSSFIPLEIYELVHHHSVAKVIVLVANVAIVAYLVVKLRVDHKWPFAGHSAPRALRVNSQRRRRR